MSDSFAPPPGPPPTASPQVPEGYKAQWNEQYKEWFYVNIYTKKSQWEKPKEPAYPENELPPQCPPPGYSSEKKEQNEHTIVNSGNGESDASMGARLQSEEEKRARGASEMAPGYMQQTLPPREQKSKPGFLGKLLGKANSGSNNPPQNFGPQPAYGQQPPYGYPPAPQYGGYPPPTQQAYPPQGFVPQGYPPQSYPPQAYPPQGYPQFPPQQGQMQPSYYPQAYGQQGYASGVPNPNVKKSGNGMSMVGGAALGAGAGLVGGMLLENAIENREEEIYQQGYQDAQEDDGDFCGDDDF